jgi:hypothetical protein
VVVYTAEVAAMRAAMHSMIVALRSAALEAEIRGHRLEADAFTSRADLGQAALHGPDTYYAFLDAYSDRVAA